MARTPTDPNKAQVWITKGLDDLDFEFYFPQGPKGDPGPFVNNPVLNTIDLNSLVTPGIYSVGNSTLPQDSALRNLPMHEAGSLTVTLSQDVGGIVIQMYVTNTKGIYVRRKFSGAWNTWRHYGHTRTDQTAGRAMYQWDEINQREQLIYGDTGWRSVHTDQAWVDALSGPGMNLAASNIARVRRQGYMVELSWAYDKTTTGNSTCTAGFPAGFRPAQPFNALGSGSSLILTRMINQGYTAQMIGQAQAVSSNAHATVIFSTNDAWPTVLPGTSSSSPTSM